MAKTTRGAARALSNLSDIFTKDGEFLYIPIGQIDRDPNQPRKTFRDIDGLADSIRAQGVVEPVVVRPINAEGKYLLIAGERRWLAAIQADFDTVPAVVREVSDVEALVIQLIENNERDAVPVLEEAEAVERLVKAVGKSREASHLLGQSEVWISKRRALFKLPDYVKALAVNDLCQDIETLTSLGRLARQDDAAARELVQQIEQGQLDGALRRVVESALTRAQQPKGVETEDKPETLAEPLAMKTPSKSPEENETEPLVEIVVTAPEPSETTAAAMESTVVVETQSKPAAATDSASPEGTNQPDTLTASSGRTVKRVDAQHDPAGCVLILDDYRFTLTINQLKDVFKKLSQHYDLM